MIGSTMHREINSLCVSVGFGFGSGIIYLGLYFPRIVKYAAGPDKLDILGAGRRLGPRI